MFVYLQQEIGRGTVLSDVHNPAMTFRVSWPVDFFFYVLTAVMQYWIISPVGFTPTIIFTVPTPSNSQRNSNIFMKAFWFLTPFFAAFGLP